MKYLVFIPARGGSVGIPNKNLKLLDGKPLIYHTLNFADKIKKFKKEIFISTDSQKILHYAKQNGYDHNYLRPKSLSKNNSLMQFAIIHSLKWLEKNCNKNFDAVIILQPTSPIRILNELYDAISYFEKKNIKSLASVVEMKEHPYECIEILDKNNKWKFLTTNPLIYSGRQTYKKNFFFIDGNFYILKKDFILKKQKILCKRNTKFFISKNKFSVDIDERKDLLLADFYIKNLNKFN